MSKIICDLCKTTIENCPHCGKKFEQHLLLPVLALIISLGFAVASGIQWQSSLNEHEDAMRIRNAYIKSNPEVRQIPMLR